MARRAAGCVVMRNGCVLLVHPSGWYNRGRPWSIPKGEPAGDEDEERVAVRETREETGLACRILADLGTVVQKGGKVVHGFLAAVVSGRVLADGSCPDHDWEVDEARFFAPPEALGLVKESQRPLLERALEMARDRTADGGSRCARSR